MQCLYTFPVRQQFISNKENIGIFVTLWLSLSSWFVLALTYFVFSTCKSQVRVSKKSCFHFFCLEIEPAKKRKVIFIACDLGNKLRDTIYGSDWSHKKGKEGEKGIVSQDSSHRFYYYFCIIKGCFKVKVSKQQKSELRN